MSARALALGSEVVTLSSVVGRARTVLAAEPYHCACGWHGSKPSFSDASIERLNPETLVVEFDRRHIPICPACFSPLSIDP